MKTFFSSLFFSLYLILPVFAQQKAGLDEVVRALQAGSSSDIARYFDDNVELTIPGKSDNYSKAQAQVILKDFFSNNSVKGFELKHKGESPGGHFCSGTLQTGGGNFRTNVFMKIRNNSEVVREIQFQPLE
jgi:hypothetical protein